MRENLVSAGGGHLQKELKCYWHKELKTASRNT
jgi:hypothetical protein